MSDTAYQAVVIRDLQRDILSISNELRQCKDTIEDLRFQIKLLTSQLTGYAGNDLGLTQTIHD